ncbi:MAG: hypothetical protein NW226_04395 [Microscillaceae bacterium]|nr:hypothetical protein [Microscillaceae bacterium]
MRFFMIICIFFFVLTSSVNYRETALHTENIQPVLQRIVSARLYHNRFWTLGEANADFAAEVLSALKPTYVSGLIHLNASNSLTDKQIQDFKTIRQKIITQNPNCKFDFPINPNHYKESSDILAKIKAIDEKLDIDIWYLDFYQAEFKSSTKVIEAVIQYAHQNGQWVGGNELDKDLLKNGDFVAFTDAVAVDLKMKDEIIKTGEQYDIPVVFQINNNTNISGDDTVHTFIKKWKTFERERHVRRLAQNQMSWKYKLMYPVFFPVFLRQTAYNAAQDGDILKKYQEIMDLYNELE